ncbi:MAG: DHH family phosphoesterase [Eubacteriales bacterium]
MSRNVKFKGQLKLYMQWPAIMSILLLAMNIWMYRINLHAGILMSIFIVVYLIVVAILYFYNREIIVADLMEFAAQYGEVQNQLLKELDIPYILVLEDGKIIWSNDEFRETISGPTRREKYIHKLIPEINRSIFPKDDEHNISIEVGYEERDYSVELRKVNILTDSDKFLNLEKEESFIAISFKDMTDVNHYVKERRERQLIAGLIYIDNYDEVLDSVEEVRQPLLIALVERKINQYISSVNGIVKKLEKDKFFIVIMRKHFSLIEEDKFSLLEEVKGLTIGNEGVISLSIGLGLSVDSYTQSYNYARVAIDLALARGGDQAVFKDSNNLTYFGGKREQMSKNTRVKARVKAEALREFIEGKDQVIAVGHRIADVDSFGAAIGIYRAAVSLEKKAYVVINEITSSVRPLYDAFIDNPDYPADMFLKSNEVSNYITDNTMVVVVDTNKPTMVDCPELLRRGKTIAVFDHHRQDSNIIENAVLSYIEPYASSTCEMVAEILQYITDDVKLDNIEADSMFAGIIIDTNNFMNRTGVRTFEAAAFLRRNGADVTRVRKLFRDDMESYRIKAEAIHKAEVYRDLYAFAVCQAEGVDNAPILGAQIANELLDIRGIKAAFVFTNLGGKIYVSARAIDELNVQVVTERLGGGGHINVAGVQFTDISMEEAIKKVKLTLDDMIQKGDI